MVGWSIERLNSSLGATVSGVDLTAIDEAGAAAVLDALHEHGLLVFRDQPMTREQQLAFCRTLGPVHGHPVAEFLGGGRDPFGIVENDEAKPPQDSQNFHVDYSFAAEIPDLAVLRPEVIPPKGGDTIWSSAAAAYDALSPRMKELLEGMVAVHEAGERYWFELRRTAGEDATNRAREVFQGNEHPVVGPHPFTKRPLLFVNPGYTTRIVGLSTRESDGLLRMLFDHVNDPAFHHRHLWREGDVVIWDEHQTTHMGPSDFYPAHRRLARLTVGRRKPCVAA
jgi:taurine dioxygenase